MIYEGNPSDRFHIDGTKTMYPSHLQVIRGRQAIEFGAEKNTVYGYWVKGEGGISLPDGITATLREGSYFSSSGLIGFELGDDAQVVMITRFGYRGMTVIGSREERGRLSYIDGCSDSVLIHPSRAGDPCLNYLHFPAGINQTQHTHPSIRMGIIVGGEGVAWYEGAELSNGHVLKRGWEKRLSPGGVFMLEEGEQHSFRTYEKSMDVIAFHPDSDTGPTDQNHPMINRTYINHGKG